MCKFLSFFKSFPNRYKSFLKTPKMMFDKWQRKRKLAKSKKKPKRDFPLNSLLYEKTILGLFLVRYINFRIYTLPHYPLYISGAVVCVLIAQMEQFTKLMAQKSN
jgi:hypothetical protein